MLVHWRLQCLPIELNTISLTRFCLPLFLWQGADKCVACANLRDGPYCMSSCPTGVNDGQRGLIFKYPNKEGHCEPCHHNCTQGWDKVYVCILQYTYVTITTAVNVEDNDVFMCYRCSGPGLNDCLQAARLAVSRWVSPPAGEYKTLHCHVQYVIYSQLTVIQAGDSFANSLHKLHTWTSHYVVKH